MDEILCKLLCSFHSSGSLLLTMMATQELVVPKSIPMTSPASEDFQRFMTSVAVVPKDPPYWWENLFKGEVRPLRRLNCSAMVDLFYSFAKRIRSSKPFFAFSRSLIRGSEKNVVFFLVFRGPPIKMEEGAISFARSTRSDGNARDLPLAVQRHRPSVCFDDAQLHLDD